MDPQRASEIKERVEKSGVAFMAELPRRHSPATLRLKELIATTLGEPRLVFCHERQKLTEGNGAASFRPRCPPAVRDLLELVDWCRYVVGQEPSSVVGVCPHCDTETADYQMMSLDFSPPGSVGKGPLAQISCSRYLRSSWPEAISFRPPAELQVCCERGVAFVDLPSTLVWFDEAGRHQESLGSRTAGGRADADAVSSRGDQSGPQDGRPGGRLSCAAGGPGGPGKRPHRTACRPRPVTRSASFLIRHRTSAALARVPAPRVRAAPPARRGSRFRTRPPGCSAPTAGGRRRRLL